jgi:hypothetical protein
MASASQARRAAARLIDQAESALDEMLLPFG